MVRVGSYQARESKAPFLDVSTWGAVYIVARRVKGAQQGEAFSKQLA